MREKAEQSSNSTLYQLYLEPVSETIETGLSRKQWPIRKAAVIGAGAMGSGIAAQLANAGVSVYLLDVVKEGEDRDGIAKAAIQRMLKATPATDPLNAGFMLPENAERVKPGNIEDHLAEAVGDADWIVEAVIENLEVKRDLYARLETLKKPDGIVSSNTSTIPLERLLEGRSETFRTHFLITHFFNPPRFMHLLEIVGGPQTDPEIVRLMRDFGDVALGKNVVICKDTPAFLANRIGIYFLFRAINESIDRQMDIEVTDAILGRPMGFPKEGIFGLLDLVGIGIVPLVTNSLLKILAPDDPFRQLEHEKALTMIEGLLKEGRWGRNSPKGGFYRMCQDTDGRKRKQALNLKTGEYEDVKKPRLKSVSLARKQGPRAVIESGDAMGTFAWAVIRDILLYSASLIPEIADDILDVDVSLHGGYNAKWGPFEIMDQLGVEWFCRRVRADGLELPPSLKLAEGRQFYREFQGKRQRLVFDFEKQTAEYVDIPQKSGVLRLSDVKRYSKPLVNHHSASLWDLGHGVTCLEFHSKMNTLDPSVLWVVNESIALMSREPERYKAMVIYNEAKNFSLGANLGLIQAGFDGAAKVPILSGLLEQGMFSLVDKLVWQGQSIFNALRRAPFPVIGAPNGMALGGGCEILLHCDAIQASSETYMGLVESGVGLIPAWGGCARYLERCQQDPERRQGPVPPVRLAFQTILMPQFSVSSSGADAGKKLWLRGEADGITMNPDRLLSDAKIRALALARDYLPPDAMTYRLPGTAGKAALNMAVDDFYQKGDATWHDVVVADALADVLTGGETHVGKAVPESEILRMERQNFLSLLKTRQTRKRVAHTLKTGKPLREEALREYKSLDEIRAMRKPHEATERPISGKPLEGKDALCLKWMASISAFLLKKFS